MSHQELPPISSEQMTHLYSLGVKLYRLQIFDKAVALFRLTALLEPSHPGHWIGLGGCYQHLKKHHLAFPSFIMAFLRETSKPEPLLYAAHSLVALQQTEMAQIFLHFAKEVYDNKPSQEQDPAFKKEMEGFYRTLQAHHTNSRA